MMDGSGVDQWTRRGALGGILAGSMLPAFAHAQSPATTTPLLWRVRGSAGSAFLFGQMPVRTATPWDAPSVMQAFADSDILWLENPRFSAEEARAQGAALAGLDRPATAQFLPPDDLRRLHGQLRQAGLAADAFDAVPADDVYQYLSGLTDQRTGADFTRLPERVFRDLATARDLPIETEWQSLAEVANFMPRAPDPLRLQLIRLGLDQFDSVVQINHRLDAWLGGDALYFDRIGAINSRRYPALMARMSGERNRRLAGRLAEALVSPGQHFVCVGIGHVTGPESLQDCLDELGVLTERV